ncbi:glycosyltransferase family 32 protein [Ancylomarina sp. YFZ004]
MIPKTIHYCWFGRGEKPELAIKCIESWQKYLPDYKLKEWNEDNFDIKSNLYVKQAYENRKFAFLTDYVRLYAIYNEGGVYMDTDVEILKSLDEFLIHPAFSGFENNNFVPTGLMAAEKDSLWAKELLSDYDHRTFLNEDGSMDMTTNTKTISDYMLTKGLIFNNQYQEIKDLVVMYPHDFFCPKDHGTGIITLTTRSVCIHHFAMSWLDPKKKRLSNIKKKLMKIVGVNTINKLILIFRLRQFKEKFLK